MNIEQLSDICARAGRRPVAVGAGKSGVVAVLGMEGRLFYVHDGRVTSLFRPEAAVNISSARAGYFNPGGDGLWPAPEGTTTGYEYATGAWRVPAGLTGAQYEIFEQSSDSLVIKAEIDLVNNRQLGIPTRFARSVQVRELAGGATVIEQFDAIEYIGSMELRAGEFLLAPWSLSQFRVSGNSRAYFADPGADSIRDLYSPSRAIRSAAGGRIFMRTDPEHRIQLALPESAGYVGLELPESRLRIRRTSEKLAAELCGVDIADAPPDTPPASAVRYSIYNDPSGFMELEVAGGCAFPLKPGAVLGVKITTTIQNMED